MPFPLAAVIAAGASLTGTGVNALATGSTNKKTRKWNEKMYARQRADSLSDYHMQNAYNSPQETMARLRKAGLNPALAYGDSATTQAAPVRSSSVESWKPEAPQFDIGGAAGAGLAAYYDTQMKEAQTDNLKTQNTILLEQQKLIQAQVVATLAGIPQTEATTERIKQETKKVMFDLGLSTDLRQNSMEVANQTLENMKIGNLKTRSEISNIEQQTKKAKADTQFTLDQNERAKAMQAPTLQKAIEEILTMRMNRSKTEMEKRQIARQMDIMLRDMKIKDLDIDLKKVGVQPTDELWQRIIARILGELF